MVSIKKVSAVDLYAVVPLFDDYRVFYGQESDRKSCRDYLEDRLRANEAVIFCAKKNGKPVGFTLLYPCFSSVSLGITFILNDLFVSQTARKHGVATALIERAIKYAREKKAIRLQLETAEDNLTAQALYEKMGWIREKGYFHYSIDT